MWNFFDDLNFPENNRKVLIHWSDETEEPLQWHSIMQEYINWQADLIPVCWKYI